jgi:hypothetical protein
VAFVQSLSAMRLNEAARSSYLGWFYAGCNSVSALFQFVILPWYGNNSNNNNKKSQDDDKTTASSGNNSSSSAGLWQWLPVAPLIACGAWAARPDAAAYIAAALFCTKVADYAIRSVAGNMVYQPLDFDCRFVGKGKSVLLIVVVIVFRSGCVYVNRFGIHSLHMCFFFGPSLFYMFMSDL